MNFTGQAGLPLTNHHAWKNAVRSRPEMLSAMAWNAAVRRPVIWPPPYVAWYCRISVSKLAAPIAVRSAPRHIAPRW